MSFALFTVSERALVARINRALAPAGRRLRRARLVSDSGQLRVDSNLGRYYVFDDANNAVPRTHVDLGSLGRELGVLDNLEEVIAD